MRFEMPKFIMREPKVAGPLTFKQSVFFGIALVVVFILYFTLGKKSLPLFFLITAGLIGGATFFAFGQIKGKNVLTFIQDFLVFISSSKVYLWKKGGPPKIFQKAKAKKEKEEISPLRIAGQSQLRKLSTQIETKTK